MFQALSKFFFFLLGQTSTFDLSSAEWHGGQDARLVSVRFDFEASYPKMSEHQVRIALRSIDIPLPVLNVLVANGATDSIGFAVCRIDKKFLNVIEPSVRRVLARIGCRVINRTLP